MSMLVNGSLALQLVNRPNPGSTAQLISRQLPPAYPLPKEKPGCWTRRSAFAQVRRDSNIQLLPYSLVTANQSTTDLSTRHNGWPPPSRSTLDP
jgi:hypothetical protein